jgi:hypothetical protein
MISLRLGTQLDLCPGKQYSQKVYARLMSEETATFNRTWIENVSRLGSFSFRVFSKASNWPCDGRAPGRSTRCPPRGGRSPGSTTRLSAGQSEVCPNPVGTSTSIPSLILVRFWAEDESQKERKRCSTTAYVVALFSALDREPKTQRNSRISRRKSLPAVPQRGIRSRSLRDRAPQNGIAVV